jgi:Na+/pantothenate symporter
MGTVFAHNLVRQLDLIWPKLVTPHNLLFMARLATIPMTVCATMIALYYRVNRPLGATGYLLIVAFDVVLATAVVPLFGAFYCKNPRPNAALASILTGVIVRITMEFTIPKVRSMCIVVTFSILLLSRS